MGAGFNVTGIIVQNHHVFTGLTTGESQPVLVHTCKYRIDKDMCRLPGICHVAHRESSRNRFEYPASKHLLPESEGD